MTITFSKSALDTYAIANGLGGEYVKAQMDNGNTLTEIANSPVFAPYLATLTTPVKPPEKPKPVEPAMPVMRQGEPPADYVKRVQAYGTAFQAYLAELKALTSRKREFGVVVNLTKGTFNIAVPDGSIWLSADGMEDLLDNFDELDDIRSGKAEVRVKFDTDTADTQKKSRKVTMDELRDARTAYRKSEAGKAASEARRATFKAHAVSR